MVRRAQVVVLLALVAAVVVAKLGEQAYRYYAYADERAHMQELRSRLEAAGLEVVRTRLGVQTLRERVEWMDERLEAARGGLEAYGADARDGVLPADLFRRYQGELNRYNAQVNARNRELDRWASAQSANREAVARYHLLADSLQGLAERIGERFYRVPTPAEVAAERGLGQGARR